MKLLYKIAFIVCCIGLISGCQSEEERKLRQQVRLLQQENNALRLLAQQQRTQPTTAEPPTPQRAATPAPVVVPASVLSPRVLPRIVLIRSLNDVKAQVDTSGMAKGGRAWAGKLSLANPTSLSFAYMKALVTYYKPGGHVCKTEVVRFDKVLPRTQRVAPLPANPEVVSFQTKITAFRSNDLPADLQAVN